MMAAPFGNYPDRVLALFRDGSYMSPVPRSGLTADTGEILARLAGLGSACMTQERKSHVEVYVIKSALQIQSGVPKGHDGELWRQKQFGPRTNEMKNGEILVK